MKVTIVTLSLFFAFGAQAAVTCQGYSIGYKNANGNHVTQDLIVVAEINGAAANKGVSANLDNALQTDLVNACNHVAQATPCNLVHEEGTKEQGIRYKDNWVPKTDARDIYKNVNDNSFGSRVYLTQDECTAAYATKAMKAAKDKVLAAARQKARQDENEKVSKMTMKELIEYRELRGLGHKE